MTTLTVTDDRHSAMADASGNSSVNVAIMERRQGLPNINCVGPTAGRCLCAQIRVVPKPAIPSQLINWPVGVLRPGRQRTQVVDWPRPQRSAIKH